MKIEIDTEEGIGGIEYAVEKAIQEIVSNARVVPAEDMGLDKRCGKLTVLEDEQYIGARKGHSQRMLEYYGGFEYIDSENKAEMGDYIFYFDCDRVEDCFDYLFRATDGINNIACAD